MNLKNQIVIPSNINIQNDLYNIPSVNPSYYFNKLVLTGPLGTQSILLPLDAITLNKNKEITIDQKHPLSHLIVKLISQMIIGITEGWKKQLQLIGVGYKYTVKTISTTSSLDESKTETNQFLLLEIGFSTPVKIKIPQNIQIIEKNHKNVESNIIEFQSNSLNDLNAFISSICLIKPTHKSFKGTGIAKVLN